MKERERERESRRNRQTKARQIVEEEASMSKAMHCCEKGERTATKIEKRAELNRGRTSKLSEGMYGCEKGER